MEIKTLMPKYLRGRKIVKVRKPSKPIDGVNHRLLREQVKVPVPVMIDVPNENDAPTRSEMESKATELGIKFDGRTTNKKLLDKIEQTLGADDVMD